MQIEEKKIINNIPNISDYKNINKGIEELIQHLIEIQEKEIKKLFSEIKLKLNKEIKYCEIELKNLGKEIKNQADFIDELQTKINNFNKKLQFKTKHLICDENGNPIKNLMKYQITIEIKKTYRIL